MSPGRRSGPVPLIAALVIGLGVALGAVPAAHATGAPAAAATPARAARSAALTAAAAPGNPVTTVVNTDFDGLDRQYTTVVPAAGGRNAALLVFVGGTSATTAQEVARDQLLPFVKAGLVSLVYPIGINRQWTVGTACCSAPTTPKADDQGYVRAVTKLAAAAIHPNGHRIYLMGYSSGAKLSWQLVCARPGPFAALATYGGNPETACSDHGTPIPVFIGFGAHDVNEPIAGRKSDKRGLHPPAAINLATWITRDGCAAAATHTARLAGQVIITGWVPCLRHGLTVQFGLWVHNSHTLPAPPLMSPTVSFGPVAWAFVQKFTRP